MTEQKITKYIKAEVEYLGQNVYEVSISDQDAMTASLQRTWTGFSEHEAIMNANRKLNNFGYTAVFDLP